MTINCPRAEGTSSQTQFPIQQFWSILCTLLALWPQRCFKGIPIEIIMKNTFINYVS